MEHLTLKRLRERAQGRPPLMVTLEDMLKKTLGMGISIWDPLQLRRTWNLETGSYTGYFERCMKEGSTKRASISDGLYEGDMERGLLYWRPQRICQVRLWKWVSASIVALIWETWRGTFS
jgi:hypothetical protein